MAPAHAAAEIRAASAGGELHRDLIGLGAAGLSVIELGDPRGAEDSGPAAIRIGVDRRGAAPAEGLERFDILLRAAEAPARPWVGVVDVDATLARLAACIERQPVASAVAAQVLRMTLRLSFDEALALESLAFSMLLASDGFAAWRAMTPAREAPDAAGPRVVVDASDAALVIRLARPGRRNAVDARMRDELTDALDFAAAHPDAPPVVLCGEGPSFSAGGDLDEFGSAADVGWAHLIRTVRSPARAAHDLGGRITVRVHGACVGAGIEVSAAAARVIARPGARFRLPEVSMGLIPGAGGTTSIPRRIGRHRACFMTILGEDVDLDTALAWGLVDAVEEAP